MSNSDTPIVSRPNGGAWGMLAMMLFFCVGGSLGLVFDPPKPNQLWWILPTIMLSGSASFAIIMTIARHRIIADENGLRWRSAFSSWKSARWDEVSDFSLVGSGKSHSHAVETAQGQLRFDGSDTAIEELAQFVAARATIAPYREWLLPYQRKDAHFELIFPTPLVSARALLLAGVPIALIIFALLVALTPRDFASWQSARETADWARATMIYLGPLALAAAFLSLMPTVIVAQIISARWFGQIERVTATERGLQLETPGQTLQIAWHELRAVHLFEQRTFNTRARFETARGDREVGWKTAIQPIIERYAPDVLIVEKTDLAPPVRLENGARFYPFRTMGLRQMLRIFGTTTVFAALLPLLMWFAVALGDTPRDDPRGVGILAVPFTAFCGWLWRLYVRGGIALSDAGLLRRGAWRERLYRWDEITSCGGERGEFWIVVSERHIKLWNWNPPVRRADVEAEVRRRVE